MTVASASTLLDRLEGVRPTGRDKWMARCPAHEDKRASLSIKVGDTGALLAYCWAGCTVHEIAAAVSLDVSDLFPPRQLSVHSKRPRVSPLTPIVAAFEHDLVLVHLFLADVGHGKPIATTDRETAHAAASRIWTQLQEARHAI